MLHGPLRPSASPSTVNAGVLNLQSAGDGAKCSGTTMRDFHEHCGAPGVVGPNATLAVAVLPLKMGSCRSVWCS